MNCSWSRVGYSCIVEGVGKDTGRCIVVGAGLDTVVL